jgi:hypothetical protein
VAVLNNVLTNTDTTVEVITPEGFSTNDATLIFLDEKDLKANIASLNLSTGSSGGVNVVASVLATGSAENINLVNGEGDNACIDRTVVFTAAADVTDNTSFPTISCTLKQKVYGSGALLRITLGGEDQESISYATSTTSPTLASTETLTSSSFALTGTDFPAAATYKVFFGRQEFAGTFVSATSVTIDFSGAQVGTHAWRISMTEGGITQWADIPASASTFANEVDLEFE